MALRKLQGEIDRTLKKVAEGVETFEDIYNRMHLPTTSLAQKEKLEADLKTQIKKLQRLRDQIKTWMTNNDIKDKSALMDNRKLIETQMERFKACEKEMKTKAFSKEGLNAQTKLDPREQQKNETTMWVGTVVEELGRQVEMTEAEIESMRGSGKKKKDQKANDRIAELEHLNDRRKWHVSRLELILRLVQNGTLDPERVNNVKEDILFYQESNAEDEFDEDEGIYDELNLEEEEDAFGIAVDDRQSSLDSASAVDGVDIALPSSVPPLVKSPTKETSSSIRPSKSSIPDDSVTATVTTTAPSTTSNITPTTTTTSSSITTTSAAAAVASSTKRPTRKATLDSNTPRPALEPPSGSKRVISGQSQPSSQPLFQQQSSQPSLPSFQSQVLPTTTAATTPSSTTTKTVPPQLPPIRYSAAAAAAVSPPNNSASTTATTATTSSSNSNPPSLPSSSSSLPPPSVSSPSTNSHTLASIVSQSTSTTTSSSSTTATTSSAPTLSIATPSSTSTIATGAVPTTTATSTGSTATSPNVAMSPTSSTSQNQQQQQQQSTSLSPSLPSDSMSEAQPSQPPHSSTNSSSSPHVDELSDPVDVIAKSNLNALSDSLPHMANGDSQSVTSPHKGPSSLNSQQPEPRLPSSLADLVTSFENAKYKSTRREADPDAVNQTLDVEPANLPQAVDAEKPRYYVPKQTYPTPPYYPQQPAPHLENPTPQFFAKLDVDTLFYIFYYFQGTYHQYLAAQELKKQSWRFHKQYLTWFQRATEPATITDEYEQGIYLYFDWEAVWQQRRKHSFKFEYQYLEDN